MNDRSRREQFLSYIDDHAEDTVRCSDEEKGITISTHGERSYKCNVAFEADIREAMSGKTLTLIDFGMDGISPEELEVLMEEQDNGIRFGDNHVTCELRAFTEKDLDDHIKMKEPLEDIRQVQGRNPDEAFGRKRRKRGRCW